MVRAGIIGVGFMGWIHYLAYQRSNRANLTAFASSNPAKRSGDWRGIQGNFGPAGEHIDVSNLEVFDSLEELIRSPNIDVLDICLPPAKHTDTAIAAIEHGKHVFIEKPMALNVDQCRRIMDAARINGVHAMVAHVLPYMGPFAYLKKLAETSEYGKPIGGRFQRIISNPDWIPDFYNPDIVGGPLIDLHVHDLHLIELLFGHPTHLFAAGRMKGAVATFAHIVYRFADPSVVVASSSGVSDRPGRPFTHGFEVEFENATVIFDFAALLDRPETSPLKVLSAVGKILRPELKSEDEIAAFHSEIDEMATAIETNKIPKTLSGDIAMRSITLADAIQRSIQTDSVVTC